ncbi:MAG TPA: hypothetical protein VI318_05160 [Baekduia sp.]
MNKILIALSVVTVSSSVAVGSASAAAPPVQALKAHVVTTSGTWVGEGDATTVAFRAPWAPAGTVTRADDGTTRTALAPDGCTATAAGGGRLGYACGPDTDTENRHLAVTSLTGSDVVRLDVPRSLSGGQGAGVAPDAVGAQWLAWRYGFLHESERREAVNWRTRATMVAAPTSTQVTDYDAPGLDVSLCAPVHVVSSVLYGEEGSLVPVTVRGRWVLQGAGPGVRVALHRCGSSRAVSLPKGFDAPVLGDGWVGQAVMVGGTPGVTLLRLSDHRRFTVSGLPSARALDRAYVRPELSFTHGRLYVHQARDHQAATWVIATVQLPRR